MINNTTGNVLVLGMRPTSPTKIEPLPAAVASAPIGPLSTIYVEPPAPAGRGDDATGARGNAALPFATLDAALAAAVAALPAVSAISLAAGTYAAPSAAIPAALDSGRIVLSDGATRETVIIDATGLARPCLDFSSAAARLSWVVEPITLIADAGVDAIRADGTAAPTGDFFPGAPDSGLTVGALILSGDVTARYCGQLRLTRLEDTAVTPGTALFVNCGVVYGDDLSLPGTVTVDYDSGDPKTPAVTGLSGYFVVKKADNFGSTLTLAHMASLYCESGWIGFVTTATPTIGAGPAFVRTSIICLPAVVVEGAVCTFVDSASGNFDASFRGVLWQDGATFVVAGAAANRRNVNVTGSIVRQGKSLSAGAGINLYAKGTSGDDPATAYLATVDSGEVLPPDGVALAPVAAATPTTNIAFPWKVLNGHTPVVVPVPSNTTAQPLAVTGVTQVGCAVAAAAAAGTIGVILSFR